MNEEKDEITLPGDEAPQPEQQGITEQDQGGTPPPPEVEGSRKDEAEMPPPFDPASVNPEDADALSMLTEQQLSMVEEYHSKAQAAPKKDTPPATETPAPAPQESEKLYAGKYKTAEDLLKGIREAAAVLYGSDAEVFEDALKVVQSTGKVEDVESLYTRLASAIGRRGSQKQSLPTEGTEAPVTETPRRADPVENDQQIARAAAQATIDRLAGSELGRELIAQGIGIPDTAEKFEALKTAQPYYAMAWQTAFSKVFEENLNLGRHSYRAAKEAPEHNQKTRDTAIRAVTEFAQKHGLTFDEQAQKDLIAQVDADASLYEERYGAKFLRTGAVERAFYARLPELLPTILEAAKAQGRLEAAKDLTKPQNQPPRTIGTAKVAGSVSRSQGRKIDLNDPDQLARLSDAEIEALSRG